MTISYIEQGQNQGFLRAGVGAGMSRHRNDDFDHFECERSAWLQEIGAINGL